MSIFKKLFGGSDKSAKNSENKKLDLEKLLSSDDINGSIIELDNYIGDLCSYGDEMNKLTEQQKQFYYNQCLEREINNGGFTQYFFNSSGDFAHKTLQSLLTIGANKTADILLKQILNRASTRPTRRLTGTTSRLGCQCEGTSDRPDETPLMK